MSNKLYAERDIEGLDEDGNFYFKHVMAMTAESLHGTSAIAAELGYRDSKIVELQARLEHAISQRDSALAQNAELVARNLEQLNNCLAALQIANKRIDTLEKYNLDLANESHNKSNMIDYERSKSADSGRAGFIAGMAACADYIDSYYTGMATDADADQYAEKVRSGE